MRQPEKSGALRTKYKSPVSGSKAACDSKRSLEMRAGAQTAGAVEAAAAATIHGRIHRQLLARFIQWRESTLAVGGRAGPMLCECRNEPSPVSSNAPRAAPKARAQRARW